MPDFQGVMKKSTILAALFALLVFCPSKLLWAAAQPEAVATATAYDADGLSHLGIYEIEQAIQADTLNVELWRASARLMGRQGHAALARGRWDMVLTLAPKDKEARQALADLGAPPAIPESVTKLDAVPEPGLGLWISGGGRPQVEAVNAYNRKAPARQHVRYVFVRAGQWVLDKTRSRWALDLDQALIAGDTLGGDATVHLWIAGDVRGAEDVDPITWERMAQDLAATIKADRRLNGVHLAPKRGGPALYPLYAALRRCLSVPLSVQVPADETEAFRYADFVVLRPVAVNADEKAYHGRVRDLSAAFLRTATTAQGKAMVGLSGLGAGDAAAAYANGRRAICEALPREAGAFLGVAVWGLVADDEGVCSDLAPEVWKQMQLPLERP